MRFAPTHDDQMRNLRARLAARETVPAENSFGEPIQVTRDMVAAAVATSRAKVSAHPTLRQLIADRQTVHRVVAAGAMQTFLRSARTVQNLPSLSRRMRE